jgi:hypothetical protein
MIETIRAKIQNLLSTAQPRREVRFDDTCFTITEEHKEQVIGNWAMVQEVFAFKQDRLTYDDICIGLRFDSTGSYWWVAEDYIGYSDFLEELYRRFPGIREDWFGEVAQPPFEEKRTTLWDVKWLPPE